MIQATTVANRRWAIVLAGGNGKRLQPMVEAWLGYPRPKQFCAFVGERSMLEHTLDRARAVASPDRIITLIGPGQRVFISERHEPGLHGEILEQPRELDTGPAVFLATTRVLPRDPEATVLIFPSDHYIHPEDRFLELVDGAAALAELAEDRIVLLGAIPDGPETDYGWIAPGSPVPGASRLGIDARTVSRFTEKPSPDVAIRYFEAAYLWNTLIVAVKARTLWEIGRLLLRRTTRRLEALARALRTCPGDSLDSERARRVLGRTYSRLEPANLSRALLEHAASRTLVVPLEGVDWSDWGRPERIVETLEKIGRQPAFPMGRDAAGGGGASRTVLSA